MGTFKALQILLAIKQLTKTSYLSERERDLGFCFPAVFLATGFPPLLDFRLDFAFDFGLDFEELLLRFS